MTSPSEKLNTPAGLLEAITQMVPHNQAIGLRFVSLEAERITMALPYAERLVGNPATGVIHGGAITALLDASCGLAVFVKLGAPMPIATLDLRIDYLRPATPGKEVRARAECFRVTHHVAFVRCEAFHEERPEAKDVVAVANGTFILFRGRPHWSAGKTP
ncbi:MAG TPA: PaaI family thioesterase [Polyangiaceae bacterium]|nr:PaaI family thioesterase [Polyangiaceae bacterium]